MVAAQNNHMTSCGVYFFGSNYTSGRGWRVFRFFQLQGEEVKGLMCYGCVEAMEDQGVFQVTKRRTKW